MFRRRVACVDLVAYFTATFPLAFFTGVLYILFKVAKPRDDAQTSFLTGLRVLNVVLLLAALCNFVYFLIGRDWTCQPSNSNGENDLQLELATLPEITDDSFTIVNTSPPASRKHNLQSPAETPFKWPTSPDLPKPPLPVFFSSAPRPLARGHTISSTSKYLIESEGAFYEINLHDDHENEPGVTWTEV